MRYTLVLSLLFLSVISNLRAQSSGFGDSLAAFNAGILTPTPDRALMGVEYINGFYWLTGADPDDNWQRKLYKVNAATLSLDTFFTYPFGFASWKDMAFDGQFLYVSDVGTIRQIDTATGQPTGFSINSPIYYNSGLAYDPFTGHFWVSGDGSLVYALDSTGNIVGTLSIPSQYPVTGLAWDTVTTGGPYLWVWTVKYTPSEVRPKALQVNPATGTLTGVEFEGIYTHPMGSLYGELSLGATISQEVIPGKTVFIGLHQSSFQQSNDQLDWVVLYDLAPDSSGLPGPEIFTGPASLQNNLLPGDSLRVPILINNLSPSFPLNWSSSVQYPGIIDTSAVLGDTLLSLDVTALSPSLENNMRGIAYIDSFAWISSGRNFDNKVFLFKLDLNTGSILQTDTLYAGLGGWNTISSDGQYIYAVQTYSILKYDPVNKIVVDNYPKIGFSPSALAYDPQQELFYMGGGTGALKVINKQGVEQSFFVTPYNIQGLAWDRWSQGGPYLWAFHLEESDTTMQVLRLDPRTGAYTGQAFPAINLSQDPAQKDEPEDIVLAPDWKEGKLVMLALQASNASPGDGHDRLVAYDLATAPAPGWIRLLPDGYGSTAPLGQDTLWVKLKAIMDDTLMMAEIIIRSNDVLNPIVSIPVNFQMLPFAALGSDEIIALSEKTISKIYPNPSSGLLYVVFQREVLNLDLQLFDISGKSHSIPGWKQGNKILELDIRNLPAGLYFLQVTGKEAGKGEWQEMLKVVLR